MASKYTIIDNLNDIDEDRHIASVFDNGRCDYTSVTDPKWTHAAATPEIQLICEKLTKLFGDEVEVRRFSSKAYGVIRKGAKFYTAIMETNLYANSLKMYSPYLRRATSRGDYIGYVYDFIHLGWWSKGHTVDMKFGKMCAGNAVGILKKLLNGKTFDEDRLIKAIDTSNNSEVERFLPSAVANHVKNEVVEIFKPKSTRFDDTRHRLDDDAKYAAFLALEALVRGTPMPTLSEHATQAVITASEQIDLIRENAQMMRESRPIRLFKLNNQDHLYLRDITRSEVYQRVDSLDNYNTEFLSKVATLMSLGKGEIPAVGANLDLESLNNGLMELDMVVMIDGDLI